MLSIEYGHIIYYPNAPNGKIRLHSFAVRYLQVSKHEKWIILILYRILQCYSKTLSYYDRYDDIKFSRCRVNVAATQMLRVQISQGVRP